MKLKHLRKFNEGEQLDLFATPVNPPKIATRNPQYTKGEILVFPTNDYTSGKFKKGDGIIGAVCKSLGYEHDETYYVGDYFLVKCPVGQEEIAGETILKRYPEFFDNYERRDIRNENLYKIIDHINNDIGELEDMIGKTFLSNQWNVQIDEIIRDLNKIKI